MADAIWNNNYLLSNLDAQKLYAQSPLTTGVSGASAYIGIEPSARYNETVLWSGVANSGSINLSEPWSNFYKIEIDTSLTAGWSTAARPHGTSIVSTELYQNFMTDVTNTYRASNGSVTYRTLQIGGNSGASTLSINSNYSVTISSGGAITNITGHDFAINRIVGINRKEV